MNIVILAAGKGTRLVKDQDLPKALTILENGKSILEMQLEAIACYCSLKHVTVVVGYQKSEIMSRFPNLSYVENQDYASENTSKSLLKALVHDSQDLLWMNGDVVFHPSVLASLLQLNQTAIVVSRAVVGDEEVKYRTDPTGHILEVSKTVKNGEGEALGVNLFKAPFVPFLKEQLGKCQKMDYFEKGIEECIAKGVPVLACPIDKALCIEIDFPEDLQRANHLIKSWL